MKISFMALIPIILISACSPVERVQSTDQRPSIRIQGAPENARILVDGTLVGQTSEMEERAFIVSSGTHIVQVISADEVILTQKIFVSGAMMKTLVVEVK